MKNYKGPRGKYCRKLWADLKLKVRERANGFCELCGSQERLETDHCFSASGAVRLRYDIRNLTLLCNSCHTKKSYNVGGYEKLVDGIVKIREGIDVFEKMQKLAKHHDAFTWNILDLEKMCKERGLLK